MNYPSALPLQDTSYVGSDYIERQRIKRKIDRWTKRLKSLPAMEQQAIINSLLNKQK